MLLDSGVGPIHIGPWDFRPSELLAGGCVMGEHGGSDVEMLRASESLAVDLDYI